MITSSICVRSSAFILPSPLTSALEVTGSRPIIILSTLVKSVLFTIPSSLVSPLIGVGIGVTGVGVGVTGVGVGVTGAGVGVTGVGVGVTGVGVGVGVTGVGVGVTGVGVGCVVLIMSKMVSLKFPEQCESLGSAQVGQLLNKIDFTGDVEKS